MNRTVATGLASAVLLVALCPNAQADAILSLQNGASILSCNTSIAVSTANCFPAFFTVNGNKIEFAGTVGGYSVANITLTSNAPGTNALAFATDTKTMVSNVSAGFTDLVVSFAVNDFGLPAGNLLLLSARQSATFLAGAAGTSQDYTGWANAANTLAVGSGSPFVTTTPCVNPATAPPANACFSLGTPVAFTAAGPFALNGQETINLNQGGVADFQGAVAVTALTTAPEPASFVLLATGLLVLVGGRRMFRRNA